MPVRFLHLFQILFLVLATTLNAHATEGSANHSYTLSKINEHTYEVVSETKAFVLGSLAGVEGRLDLTIQPSDRVFELGTGEGYQFAFLADKNVPHILKLTSAEGVLETINLTIESIIPAYAATLDNEASLDKIKSVQLKKLAVEARSNPNAVEVFWQNVSRDGAPLIEPIDDQTALYSFLWRGDDVSSVELSWAVWVDDRSENMLALIPGTDVWFKTIELPLDVAMSYKLVPGISHVRSTAPLSYRRLLEAMMQKDPLNPRYWKGEGLYKGASLLLGPKAKPLTWSVKKAGVAEGSVEHLQVKSSIMKNGREIALYRPAEGHDRTDLPLLVIFDGKQYLEEGGTAVALDNLISAGKIPPVAAVFVYNTVPSTRGAELPCNPSFADFLADELVPLVRQRIPEIADTKDIITAGSSYGGLASTCVNFFRPEIFKYVLSMSGAYWWSPAEDSPLYDEDSPAWLLRALDKKGCSAKAYYFDAGALETGYGLESIADASGALSAIIAKQGCRTTYRTFSGGHDRYHWRETIAEGLIWLFAEDEAGDELPASGSDYE